MELETFDGWTIDRRLKQLRKVNNDDKILFVDFDSDLGDLIFQKKIVLDELNDLNNELAKGHQENWKESLLLDILSDIESSNSYLNRINQVINELERKLK